MRMISQYREMIEIDPDSESADGGIRAIAEFQIAMDEIGNEMEERYKFIINDQIYDAEFKGTVDHYN